MRITRLRDKVIIKPENNGYIVKNGSLRLYKTMIVDESASNMYRDATDDDIKAWNDFRGKSLSSIQPKAEN